MDEHELHGEGTEDAPVTTNWNAGEHENGHRQVMEETPKVEVGFEVGSAGWFRHMKEELARLKPPVSALDNALAELEPMIEQRRAAGCKTHQIAALLVANGVPITGAALARRLREKDVEAKTPAKKKRPSSSLPS